MRKILPFISIIILFIACPKNYLSKGVWFEEIPKDHPTIAILTPYTPGSSEQLNDRLHNDLITTIGGTGRFTVISKNKVKQVEAGKSIGNRLPSPTEATSIARVLNANYVVISEIGITPVPEDKAMPILPLYCTITLIDVSDESEVYRGEGRAANPLSLEAGGVKVIEYATRELLKKLK